MPHLNIRTTHKPIRQYYAELEKYAQLGEQNEGIVRAAFQHLLQHYCHQAKLTLLCEKTHYTSEKKRIIPDGEVVDTYGLPHGYWEAKDTHDDLLLEAAKKFDAGYPSKNIVVQSPTRALLYQDGQLQLDADITDPRNLVQVLQTFFTYQEANIAAWHTAVADFKAAVPALGAKLAALIKTERQNNAHFREAFTDFHQQCCACIDPSLSVAAVEEMLIQHLLTERIFATVFKNRDFTRRNIIARDIETVIDVLTEHALNRDQFLQSLDPFYAAIESTAATLTAFSQKQHFLNTVYEQFFQGFSVKVADTHGIVYTSQPIVDFMVNSVQHLLETEFDRSLSDSGVHIIDPFVGTGNFIVRLMQVLDPISLERKYTADPPELQCNEVMLLPYYIASLNIEQQFYTAMRRYSAYEGICLVDTFEVSEARQIALFAPANTERVERQKRTPMFVVIGNPPYNAGQKRESDNNKNRRHPIVDARVAETYVKDSAAQNPNKLYDPYVKAIRWASDRIGSEGIVALVTNNSFLDGIAFDGVRKHLAADFDVIYVLDLGGDVQRGLKVSSANVFGIRVGVSINLFVKNRDRSSEQPRIFYYRTDELWDKDQKFAFLNSSQHVGGVAWQSIEPDARHAWLTEGLDSAFDTFTPMGTKAAKASAGKTVGVLFKTYSLGISTSRDAWTYNFNRDALTENISRMIETYNAEVARWTQRTNREVNVDNFVVYDDTKIKWSSTLKQKLQSGQITAFTDAKIRSSLYRPFTKSNLYFDRMMNERVREFPFIFPKPQVETENRAICVSCPGTKSPFRTLMVDAIPDIHITGDTQCFPFYIYDEDGSNRRENITDWALAHFRSHYKDDSISKWDIFHYTYGLLHHPDYQKKYEANLKRDLPHIPFATDFWAVATAGAQLAELHANYESQPEYEHLRLIQNPEVPLNWRVEKMKLSKDRTQLTYNDFLTLADIPPEVFAYRLGTRSALEWVIDQYRAKRDKWSGLVSDPNCAEAPRYIVELIGKVITVSLETVAIVEKLPPIA